MTSLVTKGVAVPETDVDSVEHEAMQLPCNHSEIAVCSLAGLSFPHTLPPVGRRDPPNIHCLTLFAIFAPGDSTVMNHNSRHQRVRNFLTSFIAGNETRT